MKFLRILTLVVFLTPSIFSICQIYPTDNLISFYEFNNDAKDYTNSNHASQHGGTFMSGVCDSSKSSLKLNGSDDYVDLGHFGQFNNHLASFSISVWIKSSSKNKTNWEELLGSVNNSTTGTALGISFHKGPGNSFKEGLLSFLMRDENNDYFGMACSIDTLFDDTWHHLVFVVSSTKDGQGAIYLDNVKQTLTSAPTAGASDFAAFQNELSLGCRNNRGTLDHHFSGSIDKLAFYSGGLNSSDIDTLYHQRCILNSIKSVDNNQINSCNVQVYPNPSEGNFVTVKSNCTSINWEKAELTDEIGRVVKRFDSQNDFFITPSSYTNSIYFLSFYDEFDRLMETKKLVFY